MQALIWEAPEVMRLGEVPDPHPEPGWAVVRVAAVGICGSELGAYLGHNELRVPPLVMGHEWGGVVEAVGSGADRAWLGRTVAVNPLVSCGHCRACRRGQRQLCMERRIIGIDFPGAFAERVAVPVTALWPVSDPVLGALVEPLACAVQAVRHAEVGPGDAVLVYGAGVIGLMSAWVAKIAGADRVFMVDTNQERLKKALMWGVDGILTAGVEDVAEAVRDLGDGGPDIVIDAVGAEVTRSEAAGLVRRGGRVVLVGLHASGAPLPGNRVVRDEVAVTGSFCYTDEAFRVARNLVEAGRIPTGREWLDLRPLAAGDAAFREQALGPAPYAKILLTMPKAEG